MNQFIKIISTISKKDEDGFTVKEEQIVAEVRAYHETKHGNEKWANRATFSTASSLFRFRNIPNVEIKTDMIIVCNDKKYSITSVENIKNKNMYIEVLCDEVSASG